MNVRKFAITDATLERSPGQEGDVFAGNLAVRFPCHRGVEDPARFRVAQEIGPDPAVQDVIG